MHDGQQTATQIIPAVGNVSADPKQVQLGLMIGIQAPPDRSPSTPVRSRLGNGFTAFGSYAKGSVTGLVDIPASIPKLFQATTSDKPRSADAAGRRGRHGAA